MADRDRTLIESKTYAAAMTAAHPAAIATVEIVGHRACETFSLVFQSQSGKPVTNEPGKVFVGHIADGEQIVDQVVVGCEATDQFAVHCHGNPLIVESILQLLTSHGIRCVSSDELFIHKLQENLNALEKEAALCKVKTATLQGAALIQNQGTVGLGAVAKQWLENLDLEKIRQDCQNILQASIPARILIEGAKVVLAGPPNSGKSTLFNCLCKREKAIVSEIPGTTRDWISATCRTDRVQMELYDTAGLDAGLTSASEIDAESQKRTGELIADADLILLVLDHVVDVDLPPGANVLVVFNKLDLGIQLNDGDLPFAFRMAAAVSAVDGVGIDELVHCIHDCLGVTDFDINQPVCFSARQLRILQALQDSDEPQQARRLITELFDGDISL